MLGDDLNDATGPAWDDCDFREELVWPMDLFGIDTDHCVMDVKISKGEVMDRSRGNQSLTLAAMAYEQWYRSMRKQFPNSKIPGIWCAGQEQSLDCLFSDTRSFFSHTTHLPLVEAKIGELSDVELKAVFNAGNISPVFLKDSESIVIITGTEKTDETWKGFDISDPHTIKTWTVGQLKGLSAAYAKSHEALPLGMPPQECALKST
jgi:hypothetical protein